MNYREGNGKNEAKKKSEVGFQSPKTQLGMRKAKARISLNNENVWNSGREWEMIKDYNGKREWEIGQKKFLMESEREKSHFFGGG